MYKPPQPISAFPMAGGDRPLASNMDTNSTSGSLTARRPAATNLGSMSLPPLPFRQSTPQKPIAFFDPLSQQPLQPNRFTSMVNSGNLLTPPTTLSGDSLSPQIPTGLVTDNNMAQALQQNSPTPGWLQGQQPPSAGLSNPLSLSGISPPSWTQGTKNFFSPPLAGLSRTNNDSPGNSSNGLPPPPPSQTAQSVPDFNSMPYPQQVAPAVNASALASVTQQAFQQNGLPQQTPQQPAEHTAALASPPMSTGTQGVFDRSASTPGNFSYSMSQPASAQGTNFPFNTATSPLNQSPLSAPLAGSSRFSPSSIGQYPAPFPTPNSNSQYGFAASRFPTFPISAQDQNIIHGPVMTNVNQPGSQMALVGMPSQLPAYQPGYHSGIAAGMYGQQQSHNNDRPFKCDVCPQSFNRNHDLKRHKRIHLAVKPYPCGWCDKSFSRKDALKRHILVKSCGKNKESSNNGGEQKHLPDDGASDDNEGSPREDASSSDSPAHES